MNVRSFYYERCKTIDPPKTSDNQELIDSYDYLSGAASSQDCTGLIPSAPLSEAELDSYEELYPFLPPVPPASDIKDNNEAPEDTSGITG